MSHAALYTIATAALGIVSVADVSIAGVSVSSSVSSSVAVVIAATIIALVGVPHGGLDHWTGRRLLMDRLGSFWAVVFFSSYLCVGILFAIAWAFAPVPTIVLFFVSSAWHFGREDGLRHWEALAVGGLIVWVPAWVRPSEMETILGGLILNESASSAATVVTITQVLGATLAPVAAISLAVGGGRRHRLAAVSTIAAAMWLPILWSFVLFFCGWHSIRGLQRMRIQERLRWREFAWAVAPLSVGAVLIIAGAAASMGGALTEPTTQMRMLFIGLASIAVPHLFLHELDSVSPSDSKNFSPVEIAHVR